MNIKGFDIYVWDQPANGRIVMRPIRKSTQAVIATKTRSL
jgi:hypothetical protein